MAHSIIFMDFLDANFGKNFFTVLSLVRVPEHGRICFSKLADSNNKFRDIQGKTYRERNDMSSRDRQTWIEELIIIAGMIKF